MATIASGLTSPNGVAFKDGALWVAEISRILRFDGIEDRLKRRPLPWWSWTRSPRRSHHGWKFIAFGPDGLLYVPVGAPCNVCEPEDPRFASILRFRPDGTQVEVYGAAACGTPWASTGTRRGRSGSPTTAATCSGTTSRPTSSTTLRRPACTSASRSATAARCPTPTHGKGRGRAEASSPRRWKLGAHVAALGMRFYRGTHVPRGVPRPALHRGARLVEPQPQGRLPGDAVRFQDGRPVAYEPFVEGWLKGKKEWGRPVDVLELPDGSLLVSDDAAGAVYRVAYGGA